jgi:hypothetical protein
MHATPHQHVAIVDGDRDVANAHLAGTRGANLGVLEAQHLGAAVFMETKSLAHGGSGSRSSCSACSTRAFIL